jgi:uncharacterized membrane protein YkoI
MNRAFSSHWRALACAAWLLALPAVAHASDDHDHDRARQALAAGEILPLARVLERVEQRHPGQVIDVELEREHDARWIYKLKVLQRGGALIRLKVDARDGTVLGSRSREKDREKH